MNANIAYTPKELEAIWNTLLTTGKYTPDWEPKKKVESLHSCEFICLALADETREVKLDRNLKVDRYFKDGREFEILHTYDFENYKSSQELGFSDTAHYLIRLVKG